MISWRREWLPSSLFLPGKFHQTRSLVGYAPWGCKESDTTEWLTYTLINYTHIFMFNIYLDIYQPKTNLIRISLSLMVGVIYIGSIYQYTAEYIMSIICPFNWKNNFWLLITDNILILLKFHFKSIMVSNHISRFSKLNWVLWIANVKNKRMPLILIEMLHKYMHFITNLI